MLVKSAKISDYKLRKIIKHFCLDILADKTAFLTGVNRNTVNRWYLVFRKAIFAWQYREFEQIIVLVKVERCSGIGWEEIKEVL